MHKMNPFIELFCMSHYFHVLGSKNETQRHEGCGMSRKLKKTHAFECMGCPGSQVLQNTQQKTFDNTGPL